MMDPQHHVQAALPHQRKMTACVAGVCVAAVLCTTALCLPNANTTVSGGTAASTSALIRQASAAESDFIFPRSSYELLTEEDVEGCTPYELYIARNEIFARHGYIFVSEDLDTYFRSKPWYTPLYTESEFNWNWLSEIEQQNVALIQEREEALATATQSTASAYPQSKVVSSDIGNVTISANGHVTTDYYSFDIPEYWLDYVTVTCTTSYGNPTITVSYQDYSDMPLLSITVYNADVELLGGDIGNALIAYWYNGKGQLIEMRARNYLAFSQEHTDQTSSIYPNEFVEAAMIDLSTGGAYTVETARHAYDENDGDHGFDYYRSTIIPTVEVF